MAAQREKGEIPLWYLMVFIGLPLGVIAWVGAFTLAYTFLRDAGLVGGA